MIVPGYSCSTGSQQSAYTLRAGHDGACAQTRGIIAGRLFLLHILPVPLPWFIVGPMMGLSVVGLYAVANLHLGVSGSFVQFVDYARNRPIQPWRLWFLAGLLIGGALVAMLGTSPQFGINYGSLSDLLPLGLLVPVLFVGGTLIGFGA